MSCNSALFLRMPFLSPNEFYANVQAVKKYQELINYNTSDIVVWIFAMSVLSVNFE